MFRPAFLAPVSQQLTRPSTNIAPKARSLLASLPLTLAKPISKSPFFLQKTVLRKALATLFTEALPEGEVDFLINHWLKIEISDLDISWYFSCGENREILIKANGHHDVCIRGNLDCFIQLAAQKEDPDTLFFRRDLSIEGDTNLGLEIKNLLDRIDITSLPPEARFMIAGTAEFTSAFKANQA